MQQSRSWKIVGHRGYPAKYPENTVMGFQAAIALGVDAIELDVQLTGDGVPVVLHDVRLDRTCDDIGSVLMRRWDDLKKYRLISRISLNNSSFRLTLPA
jgi:Glycerophosphoryl diester phosphodiesterase